MATKHNIAGDQRLPIYQRVADDLRQSVVNGNLKPGDRAPSEAILIKNYGVAAGTIRNALDVLVREGVFERFQGRGTFVRRPNFDASLFRFFRFRKVDGQFEVPESRILRRTVEPMPGHVAAALECPPETNGISMSRLRLHQGTPVLAEEIWLNYKKFKKFMEIPVADVGALLYPVYDSQCGKLIGRAEETLTIKKAAAEIARVLRIDEDSPIVVIDRIAKGHDNKPFEWRRSRGRADQFTYHNEIR